VAGHPALLPTPATPLRRPAPHQRPRPLVGIVYQLRTGVLWWLLPTRELGCGSPVTCWRGCGIRRGLAAAAPGAAGPAWPRRPARLVPRQPGQRERACQAGGELTGPNPTDRGKPGSKYHLLVDRGGVPLAVGLSAANTHDSKLLERLVDAVPPIKGPPSCTATRGTTTCVAGRRYAGVGPARGSLGVASSPVSGWAATGRWRSGRWPGWWATGGCRSATSGAPTSCSGLCTLPAH
jgi:Transposase DDE domain